MSVCTINYQSISLRTEFGENLICTVLVEEIENLCCLQRLSVKKFEYIKIPSKLWMWFNRIRGIKFSVRLRRWTIFFLPHGFWLKYLQRGCVRLRLRAVPINNYMHQIDHKTLSIPLALASSLVPSRSNAAYRVQCISYRRVYRAENVVRIFVNLCGMHHRISKQFFLSNSYANHDSWQRRRGQRSQLAIYRKIIRFSRSFSMCSMHFRSISQESQWKWTKVNEMEHFP